MECLIDVLSDEDSHAHYQRRLLEAGDSLSSFSEDETKILQAFSIMHARLQGVVDAKIPGLLEKLLLHEAPSLLHPIPAKAWVKVDLPKMTMLPSTFTGESDQARFQQPMTSACFPSRINMEVDSSQIVVEVESEEDLSQVPWGRVSFHLEGEAVEVAILYGFLRWKVKSVEITPYAHPAIVIQNPEVQSYDQRNDFPAIRESASTSTGMLGLQFPFLNDRLQHVSPSLRLVFRLTDSLPDHWRYDSLSLRTNVVVLENYFEKSLDPIYGAKEKRIPLSLSGHHIHHLTLVEGANFSEKEKTPIDFEFHQGKIHLHAQKEVILLRGMVSQIDLPAIKTLHNNDYTLGLLALQSSRPAVSTAQWESILSILLRPLSWDKPNLIHLLQMVDAKSLANAIDAVSVDKRGVVRRGLLLEEITVSVMLKDISLKNYFLSLTLWEAVWRYWQSRMLIQHIITLKLQRQGDPANDFVISSAR